MHRCSHRILSYGLCIALPVVLSSCRSGDEAEQRSVPVVTASQPIETAETVALGKGHFDENCASCHGEAAVGTDQGPPLVHRYYEPSHHADAAFVLAVRNGVRSHHWRFGDMPAQPEITDDQVREITRYVRWLQRNAGIF